jgi:hypothetical protein
MLNIDVAVKSFWQFARCWKNCETAKLELNCQNGFLEMNFSATLCHPDFLHFNPPLQSSPPYAASREKKKVTQNETKTTKKEKIYNSTIHDSRLRCCWSSTNENHHH